MSVHARTPSRVSRLSGVLLALALLFSGDLVRIHGHADGAPAADCVACIAGLAAAVEADPAPSVDPMPASAGSFGLFIPRLPLSLEFVRQGGLRDPPGAHA